jgi:gamma-glutamylcyclotransferase (GGCT)/AIG2-like uncharacterized protein YtfP
MNIEQMSRRCPTAIVVGHTMLENWKLVFNGVATVERSKGDSVPVVVWDIQPKDEKELDIYEGWPRLYRKEVRRIRLDGKLINAMIYIMNHGRLSPPSEGYYQTILSGYKSAGFCTKILEHAAEQAGRKSIAEIDTTIRNQIMAVRATGEANMLDINTVMRIADREGYFDLVVFIIDHKREYVNFILHGDVRGRSV